MPLGGRSFRFVFSAAGFIATRTLGASPGVKMSWSAKWSWKPETPGSDPAGARISAGKSGKVARSLPITAVSDVNLPPVRCIPSPESPADRITTDSSCSTGFDATVSVYPYPRGPDGVGAHDVPRPAAPDPRIGTRGGRPAVRETDASATRGEGPGPLAFAREGQARAGRPDLGRLGSDRSA